MIPCRYPHTVAGLNIPLTILGRLRRRWGCVDGLEGQWKSDQPCFHYLLLFRGSILFSPILLIELNELAMHFFSAYEKRSQFANRKVCWEIASADINAPNTLLVAGVAWQKPNTSEDCRSTANDAYSISDSVWSARMKWCATAMRTNNTFDMYLHSPYRQIMFLNKTME